MDIHDNLGGLRRGWALILIAAVVGTAAGAEFQAIQPPSYSSTSRNLVTSNTTADLSQSVQASDLARSRIASYVQVVTSALVLQPVIDELGLNTSVAELASRLAVSSPPDTLVIDITATATTPVLAQRTADAVSQVFSSAVANQLEAAIVSTPAPAASPGPVPTPAATAAPTKLISPLKVITIERAALPTAPNTADGPNFLLVGGLGGLAVGLLLAALRESLDRRIRTRKDVAATTDVPVVGQLRPDRTLRRSPLAVTTSPRGATAESFRALRANIDNIRVRGSRRTFVVAATAARQGSSTIVANLALAVANTATSVVVIDANLQDRSLSFVFGSAGARGLTDVLTGQALLDSVLRQGSVGEPWLLPAGSLSVDNGAILATQAMRSLLVELERRFDVVLIDAPAVATATDAAVLGAFGGATLVVVAVGVTTGPALDEALRTLVAGGSTPVGIVLTRIPRRSRRQRLGGRARSRAARTAAAPRAPQTAPKRSRFGRRRPVPEAPRTVLDAPPSRFAPEFGRVVTSAPVIPSPELRAAAVAAVPVFPAREHPAPVTAVPVAAKPPDFELIEPDDRVESPPENGALRGYKNVTPITPAISKERLARENYLLKSRELERAARERLATERQRLELSIRSQLEREKRELGLVLDGELDDTVIIADDTAP